MKKYLFIAAMCAGVCAGAYWAGGRVASQKCATQIAEIRAEQQSVNLENMVASDWNVISDDLARNIYRHNLMCSNQRAEKRR